MRADDYRRPGRQDGRYRRADEAEGTLMRFKLDPARCLLAPSAVLVLTLGGCARRAGPESFPQLAEEFVYTGLSLSPVAATAVGYHEHGGMRLDEMLDDFSPAGINRQRRFYTAFRERLTRRAEKLSPDDRADYDIILDQISLGLLELDEIQNYRHNPTVYVDRVGSALFTPHVLDYAPKAQRLRHIMARMEKITGFLDQARKNLADARRDLEEARRFVRGKSLLPLPPRDNLQVIDTPEFMRGIYAGGGFVSAPTLEPQLGAFYWITPIPKEWPRQRVESKLREYNFYKLKLLTIHEAMPGHYVQMEYANDIQPKTRMLVRTIFANGPYVGGWSQYATQMMLDEGYLNHAPELRLTFQKETLRVLADAILDIRLHTTGMTDQQALDLMEKQTFQEREEAAAGLRRAKLSSCQLLTYYVGWKDWLRVREQYAQWKGAAYKLSEFNEQALKAGAVRLPVLARLLTAKPVE
jgi:uncharacterized protein (DUF885 family)